MKKNLSKEQYYKYYEELKENINNTITYDEGIEIVSGVMNKFPYLLESENLFSNCGSFHTDKSTLIEEIEKSLSKEDIIDRLFTYPDVDLNYSIIDTMIKYSYLILTLSTGNYFYLR